MVVDAGWEVVALNPLAAALVSDLSDEPNILRRHFAGMRSRLKRYQDEAASEASYVADLRDPAGRYPDDERLHRLIADLRVDSPRFEELWSHPIVAPRAAAPGSPDANALALLGAVGLQTFAG